MPEPDTLDAVVSLTKRRGFIFPSAELYGGFRSAYDFGPLGVLLLRKIREAWWSYMVRERREVVGLEASILTPPAIWRASGHLEHFTDPLVDCRSCHERWRADQIDGVCPKCGSRDLTPARAFNLMFRTFVGPVEGEGAEAYLRPETAQGMFVDAQSVARAMRLRPPFGIAQIGKSFRNEITPGNFVFRTREFEQMEMEYFVHPSVAAEAHDFWIAERLRWYQELGLEGDWLRLREHDADELSHYSSRTVDIEFRFPWGYGELEGIANRTDFDLRAHAAASGEDLSVLDPVTEERYYPSTIEPAGGVTRAAMAFLLAAYHVDEVNGESRTVLRLSPHLAPYTVAVLPLSRKPALVELAHEIFADLATIVDVDYDETQSIGRRYRRQDEIGTPWCVTVDFDSLEDRAVTVRDRDTLEQVRIPVADLVAHVRERLAATPRPRARTLTFHQR
ncbi:glycyl-tRNA synthetase [Acidimicrobium ferrooxidans DSM 10331]|uniref:Glycine--tRNA ligase n=1 Tax=Acidimicrobium ferrooxidans (strain DSM 10331 / JCM 15462 / NBRC 103882 / ICP) TaxID=525909 RepID=C7LZN6_ACIFD|nr:glycine--tRNA ligase [Acidimicrobium ferrooxidans]ACU54194.1 glycyl-tRNA synthetase [Acidimicrobium ferrooxidans DSM 10331]